MLLSNRVALITGALDPLGPAIALALACAGADVVLSDVNKPSPDDSLFTKIKALGRRAKFVEADASDEAQMKSLVEKALAEFSKVDILVNNSHYFSLGPFSEMTEVEWHRLSRINLQGAFVSCRAVLPQMLERGSGAIVNVVSQDALKGEAQEVGFCATMGGVIAFSKALALEVGRQGIRVNAVAPARGETKAEAVAPSVVFLVSDQSSLFFGQVLCPNQGDYMI